MNKFAKAAAKMLAITAGTLLMCQGAGRAYAEECPAPNTEAEETQPLPEASEIQAETAAKSSQSGEAVLGAEVVETDPDESGTVSAETVIVPETALETEMEPAFSETAEEDLVDPADAETEAFAGTEAAALTEEETGAETETDSETDPTENGGPEEETVPGEDAVSEADAVPEDNILSEADAASEEGTVSEDSTAPEALSEKESLSVTAEAAKKEKEDAEKEAAVKELNEDTAPKGAVTDAGQLQKDADGVWRLYKNGVFQSGFNGIVRYNNGEFFVANGLLCKNANGLNLWDSVWYYLSQGQIQRQHNGFAEYNKNWFMIRNGELEESANGLYPYDGSRFLFSVGRLRRDVNGLWQNPSDNKWYYLSGGQVTKHTGVASYDGEFFKVNSGVLDTNYTGAVVYDGASFRVAKGQLYERVHSSALTRFFSDGLYQIASAMNIFKVVEVANGSTAENANVQLYDVNDTAAQKFRFIYDAVTMTWKILNSNSGAALTAAIPAKNAAAANVRQAKWVTGGNQKWIIRPTSDGNFVMINCLTGKALDVAGGRMNNGNNIQTYTSNGGNAQKFRLFQTDLSSDGESAATKNLRNRVANRAISYLGCNENDGSHRQIIDLYNSHWPLAVGYYVTYTDDWCDTFVSAISIAEGLTDIFPTECGCERHINLFQQIGSWVESDGYVPKVGDLIFYDWEDSGYGENYGTADHVGIVTARIGNYVRIIEGNKDDAVGFRTITLNQQYIRGYATPAYWLRA